MIPCRDRSLKSSGIGIVREISRRILLSPPEYLVLPEGRLPVNLWIAAAHSINAWVGPIADRLGRGTTESARAARLCALSGDSDDAAAIARVRGGAVFDSLARVGLRSEHRDPMVPGRAEARQE